MDVRRITVEQARSVRHPVLRAGLPPESTIFDFDEHPDTHHFGAFEGADLAGVATFFPEECPLRPNAPSWRLRGMATLPQRRGSGAGRALVEAGVRAASQHGARWMWCNARVSARGFYEKAGFVSAGEPFLLEPSGWHTVMIRDLGETS